MTQSRNIFQFGATSTACSQSLDSVTVMNHCQAIGRAALQSLYQELSAYPKPGLVSLVDNGSHVDMDAETFFRSLFSLRGYFSDIAMAGMNDDSFIEMQQLGIVAEERMLRATGGVNTHRGAIFNLGLLSAAAGFLIGNGSSLEHGAIGQLVRAKWSRALLRHSESLTKTSHGGLVAQLYGIVGARDEAAAGFPHVFNVALPELKKCLNQDMDMKQASIQCLFCLMAVLPDSNLLYRGGKHGLLFAQQAAKDFLGAGGVENSDWRRHAVTIHNDFVVRKLSPGGSADLLAATLFINRLQMMQNFSIPV